MSKKDFNKTNLDADAIRFMNETPGQIIEALSSKKTTLKEEVLAFLQGLRPVILVDTGDEIKKVDSITLAGCENKGYILTLRQ